MLEDNHLWAKECAEFLAAAEGTVLFHCFTGKDRTGILAALFLGVCGASTEDIAADYSVSQLYLRPMYRWMRGEYPGFCRARKTRRFSPQRGEHPRRVRSSRKRVRRRGALSA